MYSDRFVYLGLTLSMTEGVTLTTARSNFVDAADKLRDISKNLHAEYKGILFNLLKGSIVYTMIPLVNTGEATQGEVEELMWTIIRIAFGLPYDLDPMIIRAILPQEDPVYWIYRIAGS